MTYFFFSSRRRHTRCGRDWSSDVCSSDLTEFAFSMRLEAAMVREYKDAVLARHLAEAGIQQAIREILNDASVHGLDEDGQVAFYKAPPGTAATPTRLPTLPRSHVKLGSGEFSYRITDEEA